VLPKACLNGSRSKAEHPGVPVTPAELAREAKAAAQAGAGAVHVHPRDASGKETLDPTVCAHVVRAIRNACPGVPIGLTTIRSAERDMATRIERVRAWTELPDFASVNFSDTEAEALCSALADREIAMEAGLASLDDADHLLASSLADRCLRILVEPTEKDPDAAVALSRAIGAKLRRAGVRAPQLHHGYDHATWSVILSAIDDGHDVRIGLEDTMLGPRGETVSGNADLVRLAIEMIQARTPSYPGSGTTS